MRRHAESHDALKGRPFCVNVLGAEQKALAAPVRRAPAAARSSGSRTRLSRAWQACSRYVECRPWRDYDGGDHTLFLGEVVEFDYRDGDALGFHASRFTTIPDAQLGIEDLI